jgi:signal transduction histidine kinase
LTAKVSRRAETSRDCRVLDSCAAGIDAAHGALGTRAIERVVTAAVIGCRRGGERGYRGGVIPTTRKRSRGRAARGPDERTRTDRSLRAERRNVDETRRANRAKTERAADGVLDRARSAADAVLSASRTKADRAARPPGSEAKRAVAVERARADRVLVRTRAAADGALRGIREQEAAALIELLAHERATTDADLLSERARSDAALAHRDDFLGMVAHDVRNLLGGVVLNLELMRATGEGSAARASASAERIRRAVARMTRLIGDLVDVTSINAGKLAMDSASVDPSALLTEGVEAFLAAADEKGIRLSAEVPPGPARAELDRGRILQVLANLISNAIKFTPPGGRVTVRLEQGRSALRFSVEDTGPGIPDGMRRAVFERFRQVGRNDSRGQGLGLYISKSIVDAHGGRIRAESAGGRGTRVLFTVPRVSRRRSPGRTPRPRAGPGAA